MEYIRLFFSALGVVFVVLVTYIGARWMAGRMPSVLGNNMQIIERLSLGQTQSIAIVRVGKQYMLVGIAAQTVTKLCDLSEQEITLKTDSTAVPTSFADQLKIVLRTKKLGSQKGNEEA